MFLCLICFCFNLTVFPPPRRGKEGLLVIKQDLLLSRISWRRSWLFTFPLLAFSMVNFPLLTAAKSSSYETVVEYPELEYCTACISTNTSKAHFAAPVMLGSREWEQVQEVILVSIVFYSLVAINHCEEPYEKIN